MFIFNACVASATNDVSKLSLSHSSPEGIYRIDGSSDIEAEYIISTIADKITEDTYVENGLLKSSKLNVEAVSNGYKINALQEDHVNSLELNTKEDIYRLIAKSDIYLITENLKGICKLDIRLKPGYYLVKKDNKICLVTHLEDKGALKRLVSDFFLSDYQKKSVNLKGFKLVKSEIKEHIVNGISLTRTLVPEYEVYITNSKESKVVSMQNKLVDKDFNVYSLQNGKYIDDKNNRYSVYQEEDRYFLLGRDKRELKKAVVLDDIYEINGELVFNYYDGILDYIESSEPLKLKKDDETYVISTDLANIDLNLESLEKLFSSDNLRFNGDNIEALGERDIYINGEKRLSKFLAVIRINGDEAEIKLSDTIGSDGQIITLLSFSR